MNELEMPKVRRSGHTTKIVYIFCFPFLQYHEWDSDAAKRKVTIIKALEKEKILQKVTQCGRESLAKLLSVFCS